LPHGSSGAMGASRGTTQLLLSGGSRDAVFQPYGTRPHFQGHPRPCAHHRDDMPTPAEKCRHCLCVRSTPPLPSLPIACRGVRHSLPPCFGAAYVVQPAVLPRAARGGPLPVTRAHSGGLAAAARAGQLLALRGGWEHGGDRRGRWKRPCAFPRLARGSWRYEHPHAQWPSSWHDICSRSMSRNE
jgi:hypothetical protein